MLPDDLARKASESRMGQAAGKAHAAADKVYQAVFAANRPIEPDTSKKPWLAALLSLAVVGGGQLYNRQLAKSLALFLIFYLAGVALLIVYLLLGWMLHWEFLAEWMHTVCRRLRELDDAFLIIWAGLWIFAGVDAYRVAAALRDGRLVVRYGFRRQVGFGLLKLVPVVGALAPSETVSHDEVHQAVGGKVGDLAKDKLLDKFVMPIVRLGLLGLGLILLLLGIFLDVHFLYTLGALVVLAGLALLVA